MQGQVETIAKASLVLFFSSSGCSELESSTRVSTILDSAADAKKSTYLGSCKGRSQRSTAAKLEHLDRMMLSIDGETDCVAAANGRVVAVLCLLLVTSNNANVKK